jgi:acetolactate synthase I/II/III large subunit
MTTYGRGILKHGHTLTMTGNLNMPPLLEGLAASDAVLAIGTPSHRGPENAVFGR